MRRAERRRCLQLRGGVGKATGMQEETAEVVPGFEIVRVEAERLAVPLFCCVGVVTSLVSGGQQVSELRAEIELLCAVAPGRGS